MGLRSRRWDWVRGVSEEKIEEKMLSIIKIKDIPVIPTHLKLCRAACGGYAVNTLPYAPAAAAF